MKILFLNPLIDAKHEIARDLGTKGVAVLIAGSTAEALRLLRLHGSTVDLAVIHREGVGGDQVGLQLVAQIKADPAQADLPYILTYDRWTEAEAAAHQQTPFGANAYLSTPLHLKNVYGVVDAVIGTSFAQSILDQPAAGGIHLEETSDVFRKSDNWLMNHRESSVKLELPTARTQVAPPMPAMPIAEIPTAEMAAPRVETPPPVVNPPLPIVENSSLNQAYAPEPPASYRGGQIDLVEPVTPLPSATSFTANEGTLTLELPTAQVTDAVPESPPVEARIPTFSASPVPSTEAEEEELSTELPYLFSASPPKRTVSPTNYSFPIGDAVVPGGAAQSPDLETLKKYLLLREQDVAALSTQLRAARDQVQSLDDQLKLERVRTQELSHITEEQKRKLGDFEKEKSIELEAMHAEMGELKFQVKARNDKVRLLEMQVRESLDETSRLKERVKTDIRRIRVREKELENRLEILKKDSEALLGARESKIVELKRKVDLLEFNMDLLQDQYNREKERAEKLKDQWNRAAQAVKVAGGLLDPATDGNIAAAGTHAALDSARGKSRVA